MVIFSLLLLVGLPIVMAGCEPNSSEAAGEGEGEGEVECDTEPVRSVVCPFEGDCDAARREADDVFGRFTRSALTGCDSDDDCEIVFPEIRCDVVVFASCPIAILRERRCAWDSDMAQLADDICTTCAALGCTTDDVVTGACGDSIATCVDGRCS